MRSEGEEREGGDDGGGSRHSEGAVSPHTHGLVEDAIVERLDLSVVTSGIVGVGSVVLDSFVCLFGG